MKTEEEKQRGEKTPRITFTSHHNLSPSLSLSFSFSTFLSPFPFLTGFPSSFFSPLGAFWVSKVASLVLVGFVVARGRLREEEEEEGIFLPGRSDRRLWWVVVDFSPGVASAF